MDESGKDTEPQKGSGPAGGSYDREGAKQRIKDLTEAIDRFYQLDSEHYKRSKQVLIFIIFGTFFAAWWGTKDEVALSLYPLAAMLIAAALITIDAVRDMVGRFVSKLKSVRNHTIRMRQRDVIIQFALPLIALMIAFVALLMLASEIVIEATKEPGTEPRIETAAAGPQATEDQMLARF